jgi:hypothetical protein
MCTFKEQETPLFVVAVVFPRMTKKKIQGFQG